MSKKNLLTVILCYALWGILPLYWHLLGGVNAVLILCCRIVFGLLFCLLLLLCLKRFAPLFQLLKNKEAMKFLLVAAPVICVNWGVYIYSVSVGRTLDASLGYYMNPLIVFIFSILIFKEKCGPLQLASLLVALIGVGISVAVYGSFPALALVMAFSFAIYGVLKKKAHADPLLSITVETLVVMPFFLLYALLFQHENIASLTLGQTLLLILGGPVTVIPLILFSNAVNTLPFVTVGFAQYLSPTLMAICAVFMGETLTSDKLITLLFILAALVLYSVGMVKDHKKALQDAKLEGAKE